MATEALSYTGINRAYSDFAGSHACEELINLRPATEGVVPVKDFSVKMADKPFPKFFVHHTTSGDKYIVLRVVADGDDVVVQYVDGDGDMQQVLFGPVENEGDQTVDSVHFATAGNILLISMCDRVNRKFYNKAWIWKADKNGVLKYVEMEADVPEIHFDVLDDNTEQGATSDIYGIWQDIAHIDEGSSVGECTDAVQNGLNAVQEQYPDLCLGPILIAVAFKTLDGSTFWTGGWRVYDPVPTIVAAPDSPYTDPNDQPSPVYAPFFDKYGFGYLCGTTPSGGDFLDHMYAYGTKVRLEFDQISGWHEDTSIIQSVEVYCSRPQVYLDPNGARDGLFKLGPGPLGETDYHLLLPQVKYEEMDLGGQLLYHQASIPMASLASGDQVVNLTFGGNVQVTEDTLDTDAGALKRYGRLLSYNARFHYWDSVTDVKVGMPSFTKKRTGSDTMKVLVRYADDEHTELMYLDDAPTDALDYKAYFVISPSLNVKEVITCHANGTYWDVKKYRMEPSSTYNFTICDKGPYYAYTINASEWSGSEMKTAVDKGKKSDVWNDEPDAINVTEQYNPFVFLVEHSYKAPGNILDVQTQMAGITDSSYGRDPLNVFTERGTYALTQGSADVLYGAFLPVSNNVISRKGGGALPTDMGVFFLADGALWLLSGRRATLVSDALHLGPHKYVRACDGYKRISGVDEDYSPAPTGVTIVPEYDVSDLLSKVTFEEFVKGSNGSTNKARLSFNRFRMELLVSNRAYPYTYVLSLKYRQWFKIGKCIWQDEAGSDVASTPGLTPGHINVLDLATEQSTAQVLVHMQTRPFSMGYRYIHMHRIVSMVRAKLSAIAGEKLVVGLYGSDNLQDWELLAYAKRTGTDAQTDDNPPVVTGKPLKISQIRTTSSSRSWRYYTVCIGGPVPPDSDLGPVMVDYQPVVRRIG